MRHSDFFGRRSPSILQTRPRGAASPTRAQHKSARIRRIIVKAVDFVRRRFGGRERASDSSDLHVGAAQSSRTVHVTAIDKQGNPVTDLQAADFDMKVGGKRSKWSAPGRHRHRCESRCSLPTPAPAASRAGYRGFIRKLSGRTELALISVFGSANHRRLLIRQRSFDGGGQASRTAGVQRGAQMLETIQEATKHVRARAPGP